jgi:hypothetical protein
MVYASSEGEMSFNKEKKPQKYQELYLANLEIKL